MRGPGSGDPIEAERVRRGARARLFGGAAEPLRLGRFEVRDRIGVGGMGVVYAAFDPELDRPVAVKLLTDEEAGTRLLDEARAMAAVRHPCLVAVHDVGQWQDHVFLAMELIAGPTLREWLRSEPRKPAEVVPVFAGAGRALAALHAAGLVHRDFKPDNVVIDADGRPRLVDFGLTRREGDMEQRGELAGTPAYLAPEVVRGGAPSAASDQYAFCVALAGCGVALPGRVKRLIARGSAAEPTARLPSMTELVDAIEHDPAARWRRGVAVTMVAIGAGVVVSLAVGGSSEATRCTGGEGRLAGVWDDARRAAVAAAFDGSRAPYAAAARASAEQRLDDYAGRWQTAHRDACAATHVRHEQSAELLDLRMQCLDRKLGALDATVEVLAGADAAVVERALTIADALPSLELCNDATALRATSPPPEDATVRAALAELEPRRAAAAAQTAAARFDQAIADLEALAADAHALGHRPFEAEVLLELGAARNDARRDGARDALFAAVTAAQASGHQRVVADAALRLASMHVFHQEWREATTWTGLADATIVALGDEPRLRAAYHGQMAQLLLDQAKFDEALVHAERAVAMLVERGDDDTAGYATALTAVGSVLARMGKGDEAKARLGEALALRERLLGATHPEIASTLNVIGVIEEGLEHNEEALALYQRAHQIAVAATGAESVTAARYLDHQGGVLKRLGRRDEALAMRLEALRIREAKMPQTSTELAASYANVGKMLLQAGRFEEAQARLDQALAITTAAYGDTHQEIAIILTTLGDLGLAKEDYAAAIDRHGRAVAVYEALLGRDNAEIVYPLTSIGLAHLSLGAARDAIVVLTRAVSVAEATGTRPSLIPHARFVLAQAREMGGDRAAARRDAQQARTEWLALKRDDKAGQIDGWLLALGP